MNEVLRNPKRGAGGGTTYWATPSMEEFLEVCRTPVDPSYIPERERTSLETGMEAGQRAGRVAWFGGASLPQALDLAERGWPDGARSVEELSASISAPLLKQVEKVVNFDVAPGEWIDPDRLLSGQPEVWGEIVEGESLVDSARGKFVHLVVNAGMSCSQCSSMNCMTEPVHPKTLLNRGATLVSLIDVMDALGFRVKVSVVCSITGRWSTGEMEGSDWKSPVVHAAGGNDHLSFGIVIKDYQDRLDVDSLIFTLGHPAMMRRLGFCYLEHLDPEVRVKFKLISFGGTPGTYGSISNDVPEQMNLSVDDKDEVIYVPYLQGNPDEYVDLESARQQCHVLLQKQGVRMRWN